MKIWYKKGCTKCDLKSKSLRLSDNNPIFAVGASFITSRRGKIQLVFNNYIYCTDLRNGSKTYWKCIKSGKHGCKGRITAEGAILTSTAKAVHNHAPETSFEDFTKYHDNTFASWSDGGRQEENHNHPENFWNWAQSRWWRWLSTETGSLHGPVLNSVHFTDPYLTRFTSRTHTRFTSRSHTELGSLHGPILSIRFTSRTHTLTSAHFTDPYSHFGSLHAPTLQLDSLHGPFLSNRLTSRAPALNFISQTHTLN